MTRSVPLFEFMPYGAPELQEGSRPGMARALALGSLAWLLLFATLMSLGPWNPVTVAVRIPPSSPQHEFLVPPSIERQAQAFTSIVPTTPPDHGVFVPVDHPLPEATVLPVSGSDPTIGPADGGSTGITPSEGLQGGGPTHDVSPSLKQVFELDGPLDVVFAPKPVYSDIARDAGIEGTVRLRLLVGIDGRVEEVLVVDGVPILNESAVSAVRRWVFVAPTYDGRPVRTWVEVPVRFRLRTN